MAHTKVIQRISDGKYLISISKVKTDLGTWADTQEGGAILEGMVLIQSRTRCVRRGIPTKSILV